MGPFPAPVRFTDCDDLIEGILSIFRGWRVEDVSGRPGPAPVVRVKRTRKGYRRVSGWLDRPSLVREKVRRSVIGGVCGFHYELIEWYAKVHAAQLCIHAAAARFDDGLVVFPAMQRAGKSTLTVELARRGVPIYCDDVLPVEADTGLGLSIGILPRLRMPLPQDATPALREYVAAHRGPGQGDRLYVAVGDDAMVPFGAKAPVRRIVLLERTAGAAASMEEVSSAEALEAILLQNFAWGTPPERVLATLFDIVCGASCHRLRYGRCDDAAALLVAKFKPARASEETAAATRRGGRRA